MQLLLLLGVTGKHTRNLLSMRFLVLLTRVPRTKIVEVKSERMNNDKILKIIIKITKIIKIKINHSQRIMLLRLAPYIFRTLEGRH